MAARASGVGTVVVVVDAGLGMEREEEQKTGAAAPEDAAGEWRSREVRSETRDAWGRGLVMAVSALDLDGGAISLPLSGTGQIQSGGRRGGSDWDSVDVETIWPFGDKRVGWAWHKTEKRAHQAQLHHSVVGLQMLQYSLAFVFFPDDSHPLLSSSRPPPSFVQAKFFSLYMRCTTTCPWTNQMVEFQDNISNNYPHTWAKKIT
jgi:hypothetical protein